ncbi:hypothetical protein HDU76_012303, partial [Blyttiomyces sp. JEL0837]
MLKRGKAIHLTPVFAGIELEYADVDQTTESFNYCIYIHDGFFAIDYIVGNSHSQGGKESLHEVPQSQSGTMPQTSIETGGQTGLAMLENKIIQWLRQYAEKNNVKFSAAGIGISKADELCRRKGQHSCSENVWPPVCCDEDNSVESLRLRLPVRLWQELDVLPFLVATRGYSIDERACQAVRKMLLQLAPNVIGNIPVNRVGFRHEVEVDGAIRLADSDDYEAEVNDEKVWGAFMDLVNITRRRKIRATFFSSTSQGGGVALMRHALLRISRLFDINIHWCVARPKPDVFEITKHKFHNILQGVEKHGVYLTDDDKRLYESWSKDNCERYWNDGPHIVESDIIVIDDPQLAGIIPYIRKVNPKCKIIYRSHIEIRADLVDQVDTEAHHVWEYLWGFIKECNAFVSHPISCFTPKIVPRERLFLMGATTDLLDGLNKSMRSEDIDYYLSCFNRIAYDQVLRRADFWKRPFIVQVARFDPSKGFQEVIKAYKLFYDRMFYKTPISQVPQLVLAGVGSIDDPEGGPVFQSLLDMLDMDEYEGIRHEVILARLPPCDQILNALMSRALVALQLSIREGFEIKVTEAIIKGTPIIAYAAGGIPLQVKHNENGYLVERFRTDIVASHLETLVSQPETRERLSRCALLIRDEERFTVAQVINWMYMFNAMVGDDDNKDMKGAILLKEAEKCGL